MFSRLKEMMSLTKPDTVKVSERAWNKDVAYVFRLRRGMWVMDKELGIGIVQNTFDDGNVGVMLTDEAGFNKLFVTRPGTNFRQAKLKEIPINRRPNVELARALGY